MAVTLEEAQQLGLEVVPLLRFETDKGRAARIKPEETPPNIVYGLDDFQFTELYKYNSELRIPPDKITGKTTGLPLRPLYLEVATGQAKRAVPISWTQGVSYVSLKEKRIR